MLFRESAESAKPLQMVFLVDGQFHSQKLKGDFSETPQIMLDRDSGTLVYLDAKESLVFSELKLDTASSKFKVKRLFSAAVPEGFALCRSFFVDGQAVLYRTWDMLFDQVETKRQELILIDLKTGARQTRIAPFFDVFQSKYSGGNVFVADQSPSRIELADLKM